jgi:hypothetical protein
MKGRKLNQIFKNIFFNLDLKEMRNLPFHLVLLM